MTAKQPPTRDSPRSKPGVLRLTVLMIASILLVTGGANAWSAPPGPSGYQTLKPVRSLDVDRYLGAWWQQAAIPGFYSLRCARDTVARYAAINETTVSVTNTCISPTGQRDGIRGKATIVDQKTRAQLVVSFPGVPNTIDPQGQPNYVVAWVAPGSEPRDPYRYAIVGDPYRLSGFILSRERVVPERTLQRLRSTATKLGFDTCLFVTSPTSGGRTDYTPLCAV